MKRLTAENSKMSQTYLAWCSLEDLGNSLQQMIKFEKEKKVEVIKANKKSGKFQSIFKNKATI